MKNWILIILALIVIGGEIYYVVQYQTPQPTTNQNQTISDAQYKQITNSTLGVSFEVPEDWIVEDHLKDAGQLWVSDPRSLGDGIDGHSFSFQVSTSSAYFSSLLSPNTPDHFTQLQGMTDGKVTQAPATTYGIDTYQGEEFTKIANATIAGYPAVHFHIVDGTSKEWGTREMQDGYWVRVGTKNLFLYFASIDAAKKYT